MFACAWLACAEGAAKCTTWQLGLLNNYLTGGDHAQQRTSRADIAADPDPKCRYCDQEEETQEHAIWICPWWAHERRPLTAMIAPTTWRALPPHARHGGLIDEDPALLDLQAELARGLLLSPSRVHPPKETTRALCPPIWTQPRDASGFAPLRTARALTRPSRS